MSEKMLVNVEIPGINMTHNFLVPNDMNIAKVTDLILKILEAEYQGVKYSKSENHVLIQNSTGAALSTKCSLSQLGIIDGERLILV